MISKFKEGDKVKIDVEKYGWQKGTLTDTFWQFLEDNKNTIFTLVRHNRWDVLWGIQEDPRWLIYHDYLIKVD